MQISRAYACELLMNATIFQKKGMFFWISYRGIGCRLLGIGCRESGISYRALNCPFVT